MVESSPRLLIAASGTGGHIFPALAVAECLPDWQIDWLGVPERLEQQLVPARYPLHVIPLSGFQQRLGLKTLVIAARFLQAVWTTRSLLKRQRCQAVFTTGGYIAAPAILAARWLGIPTLLHESNAIPGKVTRWLAPYCQQVALGFEAAAAYLPRAQTVWVSTPVRQQFLSPQPLALPIPPDAPVIAVIGGSQGAVAVNQLVRQAAPDWFAAGVYVVHLTGDRDPDAQALAHPQYICLPFYDQMAALLQRADLAVSRAGAGTLTELAVSRTPAMLIPYPYAADDHQLYNARAFQDAGAAYLYRQEALTASQLAREVLQLLGDRAQLQQMAARAASLAATDSAAQLAQLLQQVTQVD
ncbi:MAG: undecaprenyldiphospho-muramoylpentapeptide beta-N-acetylglucosaminyltransferase [Spirulinaceae cyanobacterium RM2_2_10]|nr:undecaprenyldiphospho-muramoylpentapeptide beta-N-acetylglucosaminyltransferase [Spirulinaceae cyanobacterium SM2_1_0]NJO19536.1 undecaprenyldiphospho-muramoylpentapeptide beta-N-acetylglucosaminyltransferase [Spirulinaceae cyanobacterium RM2_2_10]